MTVPLLRDELVASFKLALSLNDSIRPQSARNGHTKILAVYRPFDILTIPKRRDSFHSTSFIWIGKIPI